MPNSLMKFLIKKHKNRNLSLNSKLNKTILIYSVNFSKVNLDSEKSMERQSGFRPSQKFKLSKLQIQKFKVIENTEGIFDS